MMGQIVSPSIGRQWAYTQSRIQTKNRSDPWGETSGRELPNRFRPAKMTEPISPYKNPLTHKRIMLRSQLIHPAISRILAEAGHHATILIADGNYPASSKRGPRSELVSLNLMPGLVTCNQVLEAILSAISVEAIQTMMTETSGPYALDGDPPVWADYRETMRKADINVALEPIEKWEFYNRVSTVDHVLTVGMVLGKSGTRTSLGGMPGIVNFQRGSLHDSMPQGWP